MMDLTKENPTGNTFDTLAAISYLARNGWRTNEWCEVYLLALIDQVLRKAGDGRERWTQAELEARVESARD